MNAYFWIVEHASKEKQYAQIESAKHINDNIFYLENLDFYPSKWVASKFNKNLVVEFSITGDPA